jgi:hypothetical protein
MKKVIAGFLTAFVLVLYAHTASAQYTTTSTSTSSTSNTTTANPVYVSSTSTDAISLQTRQVVLAGQLVFTLAAQAKNFSDSSLDQAVRLLILEWVGVAQNQLTKLQVALNNSKSGQ